jgi:N-acetylmuramoyl-L-alanine amidase
VTITKIILHCSDSPHGRGDDARTIHAWHQAKGWDGIGYHYVILESGEVQRGRPHYWTGAHVRGENLNSLGICLMGEKQFTHAQFSALKGLLRSLIDQYPGAVIYGHSDFDSNKTCPNFNVRDLVDEILVSP